MIFVTGDTHIPRDIEKLNFVNYKNLTKDDYVIICGDFGAIWDNSKQELYYREWLQNKPWTTLFIDGNHENFDLLYKFPVEDKFGGKVHKINDSI
ncbi:metallophosphoesterase, partial [Clostridium botulinum]